MRRSSNSRGGIEVHSRLCPVEAPDLDDGARAGGDGSRSSSLKMAAYGTCFAMRSPVVVLVDVLARATETRGLVRIRLAFSRALPGREWGIAASEDSERP